MKISIETLYLIIVTIFLSFFANAIMILLATK